MPTDRHTATGTCEIGRFPDKRVCPDSQDLQVAMHWSFSNAHSIRPMATIRSAFCAYSHRVGALHSQGEGSETPCTRRRSHAGTTRALPLPSYGPLLRGEEW